MFRNLKDYERYKVRAVDGDVGKVIDFLLDDERWAIRHLVVDTGGFFTGSRRVLISPISFRELSSSPARFNLALTMDKIKNSPSIDVDKPVSRQHERDYYRYYGYPYYWGYAGIWGAGAYPSMLANSGWDEGIDEIDRPAGDVHLRSANELRGYHVQGSDEAIGHIEDFIVDEESWEIRYFVLDTSNWWFGKKVLVAPQWATNVSWYDKKIDFDLTREEIKNSPEWSGVPTLEREYEQRLHDHYQRPGHWNRGAHSDSTRESRADASSSAPHH